MPRPRKCRKVCSMPETREFIPVGGAERVPVLLAVDEYEAIRLIDNEGFSQEQCSEYMHVARTTVQAIYNEARKKLAQALVEGRPLKIGGGEYQLCDGNESYCACGGCHRHRRARMHQNRPGKGGLPMIIAIPIDENKKDVCPSFGRAPFYLFHNSETDSTEILANPAAQAEGGAGIKAAQFVVDNNADTLITPRCGENAAELLKEAEIAIYKSEGTDAVANLEALKDGRLAPLTRFHAGFHGGHQ